MNIEILPTAQAALQYDFHGKTAVVIDVLRATTVITAALAAGADGVAPVTTVDQARALASTLAATDTLLCGERNADPIPGFDIGNSPQLYTPDRVASKPPGSGTKPASGKDLHTFSKFSYPFPHF